METERQRGNEMGSAGRIFGKNLRRIRRALNLSTAEVSERLEQIARPIPATSLGRMESGYRKAEVDDVMALAIVLDVSPLALLLPDTRRPGEASELPGRIAPAEAFWRWALGERALNPQTDQTAFGALSMPAWLRIAADVPGGSSLVPSVPYAPQEQRVTGGDIGETIWHGIIEPVDDESEPVEVADISAVRPREHHGERTQAP